eukprot:645612-Pelagomonas_calceolata.AAC.1
MSTWTDTCTHTHVQTHAHTYTNTRAGRPIDSLSPSELAVVGTVLVNCADAAAAEQLERGLQPSHTLRSPPAFIKAYISCTKKRCGFESS